MKNTFASLSHRLPRIVCALTMFLLCLRPATAQTSNVVGWGVDLYGELGNGTTSDPVTMPIFALTASPVTAIAAGYFHTVALKQDGTVWTWGHGADGQLGNGATLDQNAPVQVVGQNGVGFLTGVKAIAAGSYHAVALRSDGTVWAWGDNAFGDLGDGTTTKRHTPVQVVGPNGVGFLTNVKALAGGFGFTVALKQDGSVWAWGCNFSGQLGDSTTTDRSVPVQVVGPNGADFLTGVTAIASGDYHSVATRQDGTVWTWGDNYYGQRGDGTTTDRNAPTQVLGPNGAGFLTGVQTVAAGGIHTVVVMQDGTVWAWGDNNFGELGDGTTTRRSVPVQVLGPNGAGFLTGVQTVAAGVYHTVALKQDNTIWAWGGNQHGELGDGTTSSRVTPVQARGIDAGNDLTGGIAIAAGFFYTVALLNPLATVSGTVTLEGCTNPQHPVTFTFRPTDGSAPFTRTQMLAADGAFFFSVIPYNTYNLAVKGAIWLQKVVTVDATSGNTTRVTMTLPAGDANNDNRVDLGDFGVLADAFGSTMYDGLGLYDPRADFNCDGMVDVGDFGLLVNNYGAVGDP